MSLPIPLHTQALYWFRFSLLWDSQNLRVSLPSTLNTQNMSFPLLGSPLNTQALYWFCVPQLSDSQNLWVSFPSAPWPNNMRVSFPSTANTQKMCFPSPLNTQALYWFRFPQLLDSQNLWVSFPSAASTQQYVNFPTLSLNHPKYVLPPPEIPPQYPSTVLVSFPSAS